MPSIAETRDLQARIAFYGARDLFRNLGVNENYKGRVLKERWFHLIQEAANIRNIDSSESMAVEVLDAVSVSAWNAANYALANGDQKRYAKFRELQVDYNRRIRYQGLVPGIPNLPYRPR